MKKKLVGLLIVVMMISTMLFGGCSDKNVNGTHDGNVTETPVKSGNDNSTPVVDDSKENTDDSDDAGLRWVVAGAVPVGNTENTIPDSEMVGIDRFVAMQYNGKGIRQFATDEEREMFSSPKNGVFISYGPDVLFYTPEEYIEYVTKRPLLLNFIGAENFAPVCKLVQFYKNRAGDSCHYCFNIDLHTFLQVSADYFDPDADISAMIENEKKYLLSKKNEDGAKYKFNDRVIEKYIGGKLMELLIYTDYAKIQVYAYDLSYKHCDLSEALVKVDSWLSNFVDSEKWDLALADANQYTKRIMIDKK